jgi:integrase
MAEEITRAVYQGKGYLRKVAKAPGVEDGLLDAIQLANTLPQTERLRTFWATRFVLWLAEAFPDVQTWDQLRPAMVQRYVVELEREKKAFDTVRLAVAPIKLAWRHMADNHPELVNPLPRIKLTAPPRREIECLAPGELAALLGWLKRRAPDLWPMACLQGLAGLRMLEAASLRARDVDLKAGTVTVTDTGRHKPKNRESYRTIPVCGEVPEALKAAMARQQAAMDRQKVVPAGGELFTSRNGEPWTKDGLTHRWTRTLRRAAAAPEVTKRSNGRKLTLNKYGLYMPRLAEVPARKLRAAFATMAGRLGARRELIKAYVGHSAGDVLGAHYRLIGADELREVAAAMEGWRANALEGGSRKKSGTRTQEAVAGQ